MSHPLAEVFGFPITNNSEIAIRHRTQKLCPFHNKVPSCTKDKIKNPLGVCSINHKGGQVITCPIRFRQDWKIIDDAAKFVFDPGVKWTSLGEVSLKDKNNKSAGNIDYVLCSYNDQGELLDFASLEVQAVYISGNLRDCFETYIANPIPEFTWDKLPPNPDYLSSSRKRLVPQMLFKGGIFKHWNKKQTVALQKSFFNTLPPLPRVSKDEADIAWHIYDLENENGSLSIDLKEIVYTDFNETLLKVTNPEPGDMKIFIKLLQKKLTNHLNGAPPDAPTLPLNELF